MSLYDGITIYRQPNICGHDDDTPVIQADRGLYSVRDRIESFGEEKPRLDAVPRDLFALPNFTAKNLFEGFDQWLPRRGGARLAAGYQPRYSLVKSHDGGWACIKQLM